MRPGEPLPPTQKLIFLNVTCCEKTTSLTCACYFFHTHFWIHPRRPSGKEIAVAATQLNQIERWLIALLAITLSGCAHVRLPAIDPTGESVFLPKGQTTTFVNHKETIAACKLQKQLRRQQRQQDALALGAGEGHYLSGSAAFSYGLSSLGRHH